MWPKQGLLASGTLSSSGWTWSPRTEVAGAAGSWCGNRGPSGLIRGWMDVGTRQWGWVEGHCHGGSHSGKALGKGGGQPPAEPSFSWSWGAEDLWALLVHLYHLEETSVPVSPRLPGCQSPTAAPWWITRIVGKLWPLLASRRIKEPTRDRM